MFSTYMPSFTFDHTWDLPNKKRKRKEKRERKVDNIGFNLEV
jgi:hypothetical protein